MRDAIFPTLRRGVSFHHVLNWPAIEADADGPHYVWPPFAADAYRLRDEDLAQVRTLGFDFIRLTVDPGLWIAQDAARDAGLENLYARAIESILAAGLNLVLDLAPVDNHPQFTPARLIEAPERYAVMVARAARLLTKYPRDRVALELFNEPPLIGAASEARWAALQGRLHASARAAAPDLALVLSAAHWADFAALTRLDAAPYRASNVLFTFHYYDPHLFTHQGSKTGPTSYVSGLPWPLTPEAARRGEADALQAAAKDPALDADGRAQMREQISQVFAGEGARAHDEAAVARAFHAVGAWALAQGVAPERVLLGEFGCVLASHGRPTGAARLAWLVAVRRAAEAQGFGWAYWAYKGFGGMELIGADGTLHDDLLAPLGLAPQ
jgi:endoglucanase